MGLLISGSRSCTTTWHEGTSEALVNFSCHLVDNIINSFSHSTVVKPEKVQRSYISVNDLWNYLTLPDSNLTSTSKQVAVN